MDSSWLDSVQFYMKRDSEVDGSFEVAALPCMPGVTRCGFEDFNATELKSLVDVFSNVRYLSLSNLKFLGDIDLQGLGACTSLKEPSLFGLDDLSMFGVLALCVRLPTLRKIRHSDCAEFVDTEMEEDGINAMSQGFPVVFEDYFIHDKIK